jgi:hypothetical protein
MSVKTYNWDLAANDSFRSIETLLYNINTILQDTIAENSVLVASVVNQATGTYNYYIDMSGYRRLGVQLYLPTFTDGSTIKVYGTMQNDGTVAASCAYADITVPAFGESSFTDTAFLLDDLGTCGLFHYINIRVVIGAGGGGVDAYTIWAKKTN